MPRALPWLAEGSAKKEPTRSKAAPTKSRKRSSSPPDLVNSDLDVLPDAARPAKRKLKRERANRTPSTSPPPRPPSVELMRDGLAGDDIWMMVEDEFESVAKLWSGHAHREEWERVKKMSRARGEETLAKIGHGTDGRTAQSTVLRMKMEAAENAKKRREANMMQEESESSDDDEQQMDPQIAGLMMGSQDLADSHDLPILGKAKSNTRAAAGYLQSPHKATKTPNARGEARSNLPPCNEDEDTDDDLDSGPYIRPAVDTAYANVDPELDKPRPTVEPASPLKRKSTGFFKPYTKEAEKTSKAEDRDGTRPRRSPVPQPKANVKTEQSSPAKADAFDFGPVVVRSSKVAEALARRRRRTGTAQGQREANVQVKQEPTSPSTINDGTRSTGPPTQIGNSAARNSTIKQEGQPKRRQLDAIPTFLF